MYVIPEIKKKKRVYFGHMIIREYIQRVLLDGRVEGERGRERPRTEWTTNVYEWTESTSYTEMIRKAQDRKLREAWQSTCWMKKTLDDDDDEQQ